MKLVDTIINEIITVQFQTLNLGDIRKLTLIEQGISQYCFYAEVNSQQQTRLQYILKVYMDAKDITSLREFKTYQALNNTWQYSAKLIANTANMLVLEKIEGETLASITSLYLPDKAHIKEASFFHQKLNITYQMMNHIHQLPLNSMNFCKQVDLTGVFNALLQPEVLHKVNKESDDIPRQIELLLVDNKHMLSRYNENTFVICHGDLNFGNLIVNNKSNDKSDDNIYVIDFESLCLMPAEYDIAMSLAVNEIPADYISMAINMYLETNNSNGSIYQHKTLNINLIQNYYLLCLYLNGLWYYQESLDTINLSHNKVIKLQNKAETQFTLLNSLK